MKGPPTVRWTSSAPSRREREAFPPDRIPLSSNRRGGVGGWLESTWRDAICFCPEGIWGGWRREGFSIPFCTLIADGTDTKQSNGSTQTYSSFLPGPSLYRWEDGPLFRCPCCQWVMWCTRLGLWEVVVFVRLSMRRLSRTHTFVDPTRHWPLFSSCGYISGHGRWTRIVEQAFFLTENRWRQQKHNRLQ
jgi:hypothetical protein